jgi:o-aminophenol oxidase
LPRRILAGQGGGELTVRMRAAAHRFHRDLPESRVWAYEGLVPGPTVEAERGQPVRVCWRNEIDQPYPVLVTLAPAETDGDGVPVQCLPGLSGGTPDPDAATLTGYTVVHLHGAVTAAPSDGWTENIFAPGQHAVSDYPMDQRAALLWYHDHVMGVTRLTVYAGLAGLWIIRDRRERELGLPAGPPFEVPLLVQDRNFGQAADGRLTGELVHKTDPGTMEAFAPFTVVNGKVWPVHDVQPATYRLRVLNGSNARTFRLVLLRDGRPELDRITQIGTDSGLLPAPVAVPADGLVLAPAERADLLVDFSDLAPGGQLTLANTAGAPFDGHPFPATGAAEAADPSQLLPYPDVMRFCAVAGHPARRPRPGRLATDITAPSQADLSGAVRRAVALAEQELDGSPNMVTLRELAEAADGDPQAPVITVVGQHGQILARLRTAAVHFEDAATFFPVLGRWEVWQLINLTDDTHPIHIHLEPFHVLPRQRDRRPRHDRDRAPGPRPRRRTRPCHRRQRTRAQGHRPRQPPRDRRARHPLPGLRRSLHVPLPHPRTRGPRHDAPHRHHARAAHALHELSPAGSAAPRAVGHPANTEVASPWAGCIDVVWVAHLSSTVRLSADAMVEMEAAFDELEPELRTQAAGQHATHRMVGSVAVSPARRSPVPLVIVP